MTISGCKKITSTAYGRLSTNTDSESELHTLTDDQSYNAVEKNNVTFETLSKVAGKFHNHWNGVYYDHSPY